MEQYEIDFLEKYDRGEEFDGEELREAVYGFREVDEIEGDERRWARAVQTIVEVGGRFFSICWDRGLTECQENEFDCQPIEVIRKTYQKTIEVVEWQTILAKGDLK